MLTQFNTTQYFLPRSDFFVNSFNCSSLFNRDNVGGPGHCSQVILPKCGKREILDLNEFGHPVCVCNTENNFYPLLPSLRFIKAEINLGKCFMDGDLNICEEKEFLTRAINEEHLSCSNYPKPVGFTGIDGPSTPCRRCEILKWDMCRKKSFC